MTSWNTADIPSLTGKLAIVTGATGGIGFEIALALARAGAHVVLAARDAAKGDSAIRRIVRTHPTAEVSFGLLDLSSLTIVDKFASELVDDGRPIDLLINNAGIMALPTRRVSADNFELQFATNYLGHFALTARLLPLLRGSHQARVVGLSSLAHRQGRIDLHDLQAEHSYDPWKAYGQSKLAMLLFSLELQRRSEASGWGLRSYAAHPGSARTELIANGPGKSSFIGQLALLLAPLMSQSAGDGALPALFAATSEQAVAGAYYGPRGLYEMRGAPSTAKIAPLGARADLAALLWDQSSRLAGVGW